MPACVPACAHAIACVSGNRLWAPTLCYFCKHSIETCDCYMIYEYFINTVNKSKLNYSAWNSSLRCRLPKIQGKVEKAMSITEEHTARKMSKNIDERMNTGRSSSNWQRSLSRGCQKLSAYFFQLSTDFNKLSKTTAFWKSTFLMCCIFV